MCQSLWVCVYRHALKGADYLIAGGLQCSAGACTALVIVKYCRSYDIGALFHRDLSATV